MGKEGGKGTRKNGMRGAEGEEGEKMTGRGGGQGRGGGGHLSTCAIQLSTTQRLGVGRHWQLQHIEEHVGNFLGATKREVTACLLLG